MTREEMADQLFHTGKEVKKSFLGAVEMLRRGGIPKGETYFQYMQMLKNLNLLYQAVEAGEKNYIQQMDSVSDWDEEDQFVSKYISVLDNMLIDVIKFRQKYCLIRRNDPVPGMASHLITNLGQIVVSLDSGYIPVIDAVHANNMLNDISRQYDVNAWEMYFGQPFIPICEMEAIDEKVKILDGIPGFMPSYQMDCLTNSKLLDFWRNMVRKYMPVSAALHDSVQECLSRLPFGNGERILGILCRGTDYTYTRPYNHPVQPPQEAVLAKADEFMRRYSCNYCYLATEDREILQSFSDKFKDRLLTTQEIYYEPDLQEGIHAVNKSRGIDLHQKNMEYLTALILLSKCQYFIGGRTSGTIVSLLFSEGFEDEYIWNCGRYGIDDAMTLEAYIG